MRPIPRPGGGAHNAFKEGAMGQRIDYPPAGAFEELRQGTLAFELEMASRYRAFADWFSERGMESSAAVCEALSIVHRDCHAKLVAAAADPMAVVTAGREGALDWERLIDMGVGPGLALGAERRLRRGPPEA
jgi:hypothetical protein